MAAMPATARRRATYQDVLDAPENMVAEILDGEHLSLHPRPAGPHTRAGTQLGRVLGPFDRDGRGGDEPGGWILLDEPEIHFEPQDKSGRIAVPDIGGWRRTRMPTVTRAAFFTIVPDWVCEILSPSTAKTDRTEKLPLYAQFGVRHVWLLDPLAHTLEVFRLAELGAWRLVATWSDDDRVRADPFEAMELALADLWADVEA
jgi:Uma2 family endonuclease